MTKATTKKAAATKAPKADSKAARTRKASNGNGRSAANPDALTTVIHDRTGAHVVATSAGGATISYPRNRETEELRKLAVVGGSFKALNKAVAALPPKEAHLAKGVDSRNSPHSVKAHRDAKANGKAAKAEKPAKADKAAAKAAAKAERKAKRAEKAAPKADDNRKITVKDKKFTFGGEGTARRASWDAVKSGMTVAEYVKAGGKAKYLPRWVSAGAIKLG